MKNITYAFVLLFGLIVNAQIKFEKGYYINNNKQRVEGYIKDQDWKNNPSDFEFKTNLNETQSQQIQLFEALEFGIEGVSTYRRFEVKIEKTVADSNFLNSESEPQWSQETLFLKVISEGSATLYQYKKANLQKFFFQLKNEPVQQLVWIKYIDTENQQIKSNSQYKRQLFAQVNCGMDMPYFDKIGYSKSDLVKHFEQYNVCKGDVIKVVEKTTKGSFHLKSALGVFLTKLSIADINNYKNLGTDISGKLVPSIGFEAEYILPFNKNKWSLFIHPNYQKYSVQKSYEKANLISSIDPTVQYELEADYSFIELPIGLRHYMFLNSNSKIFLDAMINLNFTTAGNMVFYREDSKIDDLEISAPSGYAVGLGYNYKNIGSIELRYNLVRNILANYNQWEANYSSVGIIATYSLF
ncbi:hypothetical protein KIH23_03200 [Flavobacterium sp. CYK-55]|uniref:hypothetical protein n=1 Tax=Flavobacterium sp. CYK-55 TaxID=2835529 RepID=UPI001BCF1DF5|nr:hypothetical protein [Flavobacterium sp. CYK-55]MBS7786292.1 hypothetical protein [Flavobacterium sp. CYK-55]